MQVAVEHPEMSEEARLAAFSAVSTALALRSDHRLAELVDAAVPLGSGIGGKSARMEVDGKPVFGASVVGLVSVRGGSSPFTP